jgi:hypothetical protein
MNSLEFIASIIDSLAWPAALFSVIFFFRGKVPELIPYINKLKYKEFELEFRESVRELGAEAKALEGERATEPPEDPNVADQLYALAEISPRAAILEAWLGVESHAAMALRSREVATDEELRKLAPMRLARLIESTTTLNDEELKIFHKLRELRNRAVHLGDPDLTAQDVAEYIDLSFFLIRQFRKSVHPARVARDR